MGRMGVQCPGAELLGARQPVPPTVPIPVSLCATGALKSYLRELPEPLMTFELYEEWIQASK